MKEKLKKRQLTFGSWITIASPSIAEIMVRCGFDWLTIDMEHSPMTLKDAQNLIQVIDLAGGVPLVRVECNDYTFIKKVMDCGAHGVIVPMVNTEQDAIDAVESVKYPPDGIRGVGLARAQGYGFEFEKYKKWLEKDSIVIVQIENIKAVENFKEIMTTDGVDGFIIGPYDLSASLGKPGEFDDPEVMDALEEVERLSKQMKLLSGFHVVQPDYKQVNQKIKDGYRFIAVGIDSLFLGNSCRSILKDVDRI